MLIYHATLHGFRIVRRINSHLISDMPFIQVGQLPDQIFYRATTHRRNGKYAARDKYNMFFVILQHVFPSISPKKDVSP